MNIALFQRLFVMCENRANCLEYNFSQKLVCAICIFVSDINLP